MYLPYLSFYVSTLSIFLCIYPIYLFMYLPGLFFVSIYRIYFFNVSTLSMSANQSINLSIYLSLYVSIYPPISSPSDHHPLPPSHHFLLITIGRLICGGTWCTCICIYLYDVSPVSKFAGKLEPLFCSVLEKCIV